jgi:hypothetical protein
MPTVLVALGRRFEEPLLNVGEPWAERILAELPELGRGWEHLIRHALTLKAGTPSAAWERTAAAIREALRGEAVRERLLSWLDLVGRPRTIPLLAEPSLRGVNRCADPFNALALRGLVWFLVGLPAHPDTALALGRLTEASLREAGPCCGRLAGSCVQVLARMDGDASTAMLGELVDRVTDARVLTQLRSALQTRLWT